jgi:hypothetical protein
VTSDTNAEGSVRLAPAPVVALIDLGNVCPNRSEQDHLDALLLLGEMLRRACPRDATARQHPIEVECRLYGGFRDINGGATERRAWVTRHLGTLRGLADGVRVVPTIVDHIVTAPDALLAGTYVDGRQKMVDGMISDDLFSYARSGHYASIILVSDDEDFVPAVLSATRTTPTLIRWLRKRARGRNDQHFLSSIDFLTDSRWPA